MAVATSAPFRPSAVQPSMKFNPHIAQGNQLLQSVRSVHSDSNSVDHDTTSQRIANSIDSMTKRPTRATKTRASQRPNAVFSRVSNNEENAANANNNAAGSSPSRVNLGQCGGGDGVKTRGGSWHDGVEKVKTYASNNCNTILYVVLAVVGLMVLGGVCMSMSNCNDNHAAATPAGLAGGGSISEMSTLSSGGNADFSSLSFLSTE